MNKGFFSSSEVQGIAPAARIARCGMCGLHRTCKSPKMPVTGDGMKRILFVAEAPGKQEDRDNEQLVGDAGQRLRKTLKQLGVDLDRDCKKTNALICRPPRNRKPTDREIEACRPNLMKAIKKASPNVIVLLGEVAAKSLLTPIWGTDIGKISRWAGWAIPCTDPNVWIVPTYHPSYILRQSRDVVLAKMFKSHLKLAVQKAESKPWKKIPDYKSQVEVIMRPSKAADAIRDFENFLYYEPDALMSFDYETNCLKPDGKGPEIVSCSVCWNGKRTIVYPWQGEAIEATSELLKSSAKKIGANIKFEERWTMAKLGHRVRNWYWDTMLAAHVLDNRSGITSLNFQAFVQLGQSPYDKHIKPFLKSQSKSNRFNRIKELDLKDLLLYNGMDSLLEYKLAEIQMRQMRKLK